MDRSCSNGLITGSNIALNNRTSSGSSCRFCKVSMSSAVSEETVAAVVVMGVVVVLLGE